jgi:hypothetical protein
MTDTFPRLEFFYHGGREPLALHCNHVDDRREQHLDAPSFRHRAAERVLTLPAASAAVASAMHASTSQGG